MDPKTARRKPNLKRNRKLFKGENYIIYMYMTTCIYSVHVLIYGIQYHIRYTCTCVSLYYAHVHVGTEYTGTCTCTCVRHDYCLRKKHLYMYCN